MGYHPGQKCPFSGIYRCDNCRIEITLKRGDNFPPCKCGEGEWVLIRPDRKSFR